MNRGGAPIADIGARAGSEPSHATAVRAMFNRIAPTYDVLNRTLSGGLDGAWRRRAVLALRGAPRGATLDLCAGTMDLTRLLDAARPVDPLIALDFSETMLARGRFKAPRAQIVVGDALALPFEAKTIAAIVCGFGVRNFADVRRGVEEVRRVLAGGGVFVTLEFFHPERRVTRAFHRAYASVLLPAVGGVLSGDRAAYAYLARSMDGFMTREGYERLLREVGFVRVESQELTLGVASIVRAEVPS